MATTVPNTFVNGTNADATQINADFASLASSIDGVATQAGVPTPAVKQRGAANIATSEARTNTAYGLLATPDRVTGIVLPTNGLIRVMYQATWQESVEAAARAAIFLNSNQLKLATIGQTVPTVQEARCAGAANVPVPLGTGGQGLASVVAADANVWGGDVTTGQVIGFHTNATGASDDSALYGHGACYIFAAPGTYDVSVQFKASSGTVTALNRKLWVAAEGF